MFILNTITSIGYRVDMLMICSASRKTSATTTDIDAVAYICNFRFWSTINFDFDNVKNVRSGIRMKFQRKCCQFIRGSIVAHKSINFRKKLLYFFSIFFFLIYRMLTTTNNSSSRERTTKYNNFPSVYFTSVLRLNRMNESLWRRAHGKPVISFHLNALCNFNNVL